MKTKLLVILFSFCIITINKGQERITSYQTSNEDEIQYFQTFGGKNYLFSFSTTKELKITVINDDGTLTYQGVYPNIDHQSSKHFLLDQQYMLVAGNIGVSLNDFKLGKASSIIADNQFFISVSSILHFKNGNALFMNKYPGEVNEFPWHIDIANGANKLPIDLTYVSSNNGMAFGYKSISNSLNQYYLIDVITSDRYLIIDSTAVEHGIHFKDDKAWYLNSKNELMYFDLGTKEIKSADIKVQNKPSYSHVTIKDKTIAIIYGTADTLCFETYNLDNKLKLKSFRYNLETFVDLRNTEWFASKVLMTTYDGRMIVLNSATGSLLEYDINLDYKQSKWPIVGGRYVFNQKEDKVFLYGLDSYEIIENNITTSSESSSYPSVINVKGNYYSSVIHRDKSLKPSYKIDLLNKKIDPISLFQSINHGLYKYSILSEKSEDIYLCSDSIYLITGKDFKILNTLASQKTRQHKWYDRGDRLFAASYKKDSLVFFEYISGREKRIGYYPTISPEKMSGFSVTDRYIYIIMKPSQVIRVDRETNIGIELSEYASSLLYFFDDVSTSSSYFLPLENATHELRDDGTIQIFPGYPLNLYIHRVGKNIYSVTRDNVYIWQEYKFKPIVNTTLDFPYDLEINGRDELFIIDQISDIHYIYDGKDAYPLNYSNDGEDFKLVNYSSDFGYGTFINEPSNGYIIDFTSKSLLPIGSSFSNGEILNCAVIGGDTILISQKNGKLITSKCSNIFTIFTTLFEYDLGISLNLARLQSLENVALLQTESGIFIIYKNGKIAIVPDLFTSSTTELRVLRKNGFLYFYAQTLEKGRQLYCLSSSNVISNIDQNISSKNINIYPNPTSNEINIDGDKNINGKYIVYDSYGKNVLNGTFFSNMQIHVDALPVGTYFLKLESDDITYHTFIKI